jgi:hypothetical protein
MSHLGHTPMLGVETEFGNDWTRSVTYSYKPPKAKTPARTQGFFQFQMVTRGGIDHGRWVFDSAYSLLPAKVQFLM